LEQNCAHTSALLMLIIASCSSGSSGPSARNEPALVGPTWVAEQIGRVGVLDNVRSTMSIDAAGRVSGRGGCNSYGGAVDITGEAIRFGPLASTRIACAPAVGSQEQRFFSALASVRRYGFTPEGRLVFYGENGSAVVTFGRLTGHQQP
jgi:heat shock protein HslJ